MLQGKYDEAEPLWREAIRIGKKILGREHPDVAVWLNNLASLLIKQLRLGEAEKPCFDALKIRQAKLGEDHLRTAQSHNTCGELLRCQGHLTESRDHYEIALRLRREKYGDRGHEDIAETLHGLALLAEKEGNSKEARALGQEAVEICTDRLGENHPKTKKYAEHRFH
jgi:tetratricopeptide (TPR) repeat protein